MKSKNKNELLDLLNGIITKEKECYIKIHFGRTKKINSYINPQLFNNLVQPIFFVDTNTLYSGERHSTLTHIQVAYSHGFKPIKILDDDDLLNLHETTIINIAHITGHKLMGLGGCIKNIGMGLATKDEKLWIHGGGRPMRKAMLPSDKRIRQAYRLGQIAKKVTKRIKRIYNIAVADEITRLCDCQGDSKNRIVLWKGFKWFTGEDCIDVDKEVWNNFGSMFLKYYPKELIIRQIQGYQNEVL